MHSQATSTAFLRALESHAVWNQVQQRLTSSRPNSKMGCRFVRNVFALDSFQQLFFLRSNGNGKDDEEEIVKDGAVEDEQVEPIISVINLKRLRQQQDEEDDDDEEVSGGGPLYQTLRCNPPLGFAVRELVFNSVERANLLCAVGRHQCAVIEISDHVRREFFKDGPSLSPYVECRTFHIGSFFHTTNPRLVVRRAAWHPLSDNHLAVLASDNTLRMYDLATDIDEPEQVLRLYALDADSGGAGGEGAEEEDDDDDDDDEDDEEDAGNDTEEQQQDDDSYPPTAIDLCFGSSRLTWDCFTVYFLADSGEIYGLCPIVPFSSILADTLLARLRDRTRSASDSLDSHHQHHHHHHHRHLQRRYKAQLAWLTQVRGPTEFRSTHKAADSSKNGTNVDRKRKMASSSSPAGGVESWVLSRRPPDRRLLTPMLQGPLEASSEGFEPPRPGQSPVGILGIGSSPAVLLRSYLNGYVDIFLAFDELEPDWPHLYCQPRHHHHRHHRRRHDTSALTLFERIDLSLPPPRQQQRHGKDGDDDDDEITIMTSSLVPIMSLDPVNKSQVYVRHAAGLHLLHLAWLDRLEAFTLSSSPSSPSSSSSLPDLPPTEEEILLRTVSCGGGEGTRGSPEFSPLLGFTPVRDPALLCSFAVALTSTGKCVCIKLDDAVYAHAASLLLAVPPPPSLALSPIVPIPSSSSSSSSSPYTSSSSTSSFEATIRPLVEKRLPRIAPISTRDASMFGSPDALQFMTERCQLLRREYVLHIQRLAAEIREQAVVLSRVHERQEAQAREMADAVRRLQASGESLQAKMKHVGEFQEMLTRRTQLAMELITAQKPGLSSAEHHFLKELREKKHMLPAFKAKIEQLRIRSEELLREQEESPYAINERHLKKIQPILEEEMKMIADTVDGMRRLQLDIEREFPDT